MKTKDELKPNYSPVYAALYPAFAKIFQQHGYALAIHGSMARDFDVVAIPWSFPLSTPRIVMNQIVKEFDVYRVGKPQRMSYGRFAYTLSIGHGQCRLDLSFFPNILAPKTTKREGAK